MLNTESVSAIRTYVRGSGEKLMLCPCFYVLICLNKSFVNLHNMFLKLKYLCKMQTVSKSYTLMVKNPGPTVDGGIGVKCGFKRYQLSSPKVPPERSVATSPCLSICSAERGQLLIPHPPKAAVRNTLTEVAFGIFVSFW